MQHGAKSRHRKAGKDTKFLTASTLALTVAAGATMAQDSSMKTTSQKSGDIAATKDNLIRTGGIEDVVLDSSSLKIGVLAEVGGFLYVTGKHVMIAIAMFAQCLWTTCPSPW